MFTSLKNKKAKTTSTTESLKQRIDAAEKKRIKTRADSIPEAKVVSPVEAMTTPYTIVGLVLRLAVVFMTVVGLNLFLFDALNIVILRRASSENITVSAGFIIGIAAVVSVYVMLLSLTKPSRILSPFVTVGAVAAYVFLALPDPVSYIAASARCFLDLILKNLGDVGYTTYMQYISEGSYGYTEEPLVKLAIGAIVVLSGLIVGAFVCRRVHPVGIGFTFAAYMVPVFMFNITRTNKGFACALMALCGIIALYTYDCVYGGINAKKKAKKAKKSAKKSAKLAAKKAKAEAKLNLKNASVAAYNKALSDGRGKKDAKKAKAAVIERAKKNAKNAALAAKEEKKAAKIAKTEAKKLDKAEKKRVSFELKKEKAKLNSLLARAKKTKSTVAMDEYNAALAEYKAKTSANKKLKRASGVNELKTRAASGFAGGTAVLIAFLAIWIPLAAVKKNFPIIDVINNKMQLARTYVTAYLMGDDIDLNSLAMYGGVAELNPRNVDFNTPQYTGQKLFSVEAGYIAPVYMRSWIGSDYDLETDHWSSADSDEVIAYRSRFGTAYTPDNVSYFFNKYVYPNALEVNKVDQYRNLDEFGFRVFQVHVTRVSGNSKIIFVPSIMNTGLGIMERGSIDKIEKKYSAYYDGIYSSRFFDESTSYSVSSYNPVMKHPDLAENLEGSIKYYNLAKTYADTIDAITKEINENILFDEEKEYTYETPIGEIKMTGTDLSFLIQRFEEDIAKFNYKYKAQNFVEMYLAMTSAERRQFSSAYDWELNYRDYTEETYRTPFGSEEISALARQILDDARIVMNEKPSHDKSYLETRTENQIKRMSATEKYGNYYESWFTDKYTGETVPRHKAIMAVINYLRNNYTYTLYPNCPKTELLDEDGNVVLDEEGNPIMVNHIEADSNLEAFLFDIKEGYCVHFATSAIALLREMGFAVRYDEGYIADGLTRTYAQDAVSTYRTSVRDYDAHAWIEVYYPGMGWMIYECTPSFCAEMYDIEAPASSSGFDSSKVTVIPEDTGMDDAFEVTFGTEDEVDYTPLIIALSVTGGVIVILSVVWAFLKHKAMKAVEKRKKLTSAAKNEDGVRAGEVDIHSSARNISDCIFDILASLGVSPNTGELPSEYAARVEQDYADISTHRITDIMSIIEKEEFGGKITPRELSNLAEYLDEIESSVYAGLSAAQRFRMRYIHNVI